MRDAVAKHAERRAYPRYEVTIRFDLQLRDPEVPDLPVAGATLDLSRGGMRAQTTAEVASGSRCTVCFAHPTGLTPQIRPGWVLRSAAVEDGYEVAVRFEPRYWVRE